MEETSIYYLVTEHPILTFIFSAIFVVALTIVIVDRALKYREKLQEEKSKK